MKRILVLVCALVMVVAVASTAFAAYSSYTNKAIVGGPSQDVLTGTRERSNNIYVNVTGLKNLKEGFRFRGYDHSTGSTCTVLSDEITGTGNWYASYTSLPTTVRVKMSIKSSDPSISMEWSGSITA